MTDFFKSAKYAGVHLLIEVWTKDTKQLESVEICKKYLLQAALDTGATILSSHFHDFGEGYGVTGVVILSESHISIHTFPENGYAALDIFTCGSCVPSKALPGIRNNFKPTKLEVKELLRGTIKNV